MRTFAVPVTKLATGARRRTLAPLVTLLTAVGCMTGEPGPSPAADTTGPDIRTPPGSDGAAGCGAITATGHCDAQQAVFCDVDANVGRRIDCAASGQSCAVDPARGAGCTAAPTPAPTSDACSGLTFYGECSGSVARWCEGGEIKTFDCGASALSCATEVCFDGAACCTTAQIQSECQTLGVYGACGGPQGNDVRWCDSAGTIHTIRCAATGKTCELDACGFGAQCC
jgi:hypothetical protein